jgi:hypothetical protein
MKFAAVASKPKPVAVKKDKPSRKPVKTTTSVVKTSKPSRTPVAKTKTVSSGPSSRSSRGSRSKPTSYSSYSRLVGGR